MKINKKMILNYLALLLVLAGSASCDKELSDVNGAWVCSPEPGANATITLTFKSGKAYVSTSPQDINSVTEKRVLFNDGTQYIVRGDTLYDMDSSPAFVGTMLSSNRMKLQNLQNQIALYTYISDYIFKK